MTEVSNVEELTEYFTYLDGLRKSGATNMFYAAPYLVETYDITKPAAKEILLSWIESFSDDSPAIRAAKVVNSVS